MPFRLNDLTDRIFISPAVGPIGQSKRNFKTLASGYLKKLRSAHLTARAQLDEAIRDTPTTMMMEEEHTEHMRVRLAGVFDSLGEKVATNTPDFLPPLSTGMGFQPVKGQDPAA